MDPLSESGIQLEPFEAENLLQLPALNPADWPDISIPLQQYLDSPACHPVQAMEAGRLVGLGTNILHQDTAWLAHIIVHPACRKRGIGQLVTRFLLEDCLKRGIKTIYLDATDLGHPVYEKAGFVVEETYTHWRGEMLVAAPNCPQIQPFQETFREAVYQLDQRSSGEYRQATLEAELATAHLWVAEGQLQGVFFPELDDGLILAKNEQTGVDLMRLRLQNRDFASTLSSNQAAAQFLKQVGFRPIRSSHRMRWGKERPWQAMNFYNRLSGRLG